jgi:hypothetical protein
MVKMENPKYNNPLLEAYKLYGEFNTRGTNSFYWKQQCLKIGDAVCAFAKYPISFKNVKPKPLEDIHPDLVWIPSSWAKSLVSCGLNDDMGFQKIADFSNRNIWEVGAGSGYNARVLEEAGCNVYATDIRNSTYGYGPVFTDIYYEPFDQDRLKEIVKNDGAIMYVWSEQGFPNLKTWIKLGGRKVITCGCYAPDHFWLKEHPDKSSYDAPTCCPVFPPKKLRDKFELVGKHRPPYFDNEDKSVHDIWEFWQLKDIKLEK